QDSVAYINENGGINGQQINLQSVDYGYEIPRAIAAYKKWQSSLKPVAILGWGTSDTEALVPFITKDKIVYMSASYSGHLTDPTGEAEHSDFAAPYNFFAGPTYSDACRAQASWAMEDWQASGEEGQPKWIHMGADHPYSNAPKAACSAWAEDLGFEVLPSITFSLSPSDFKSQCLSLKSSGANYAYLGNTAASTAALLKACETVGTEVQFVANVWGFDEDSVSATGAAADGFVFPAFADWQTDVPGMETVRAVSKMSDASGDKQRVLAYIRGVCSTFFLRDGMRIAAEQGEVTSDSIKAALETMEEHVPEELEGVCLPATWTATNHRGTVEVRLYQNHWNDGDFEFERLTTVELPRGEEFLGW
ncbi:MAG TPA: ABC transporter substrate-binding protein, partial [Salinisphaeraceae bacterium]|nr:ABC transporter substrate-binding protein [Salinisphaeraceae bacterium]